VLASAANTHDSKLFEPLLDTVPEQRELFTPATTTRSAGAAS
jgi:hypothetical protein